MYRIITNSENYSVDQAGNIERDIGMAPSGQWKAVALIRRNNFGTLETIPFAQWADRIDSLQWLYKNGKPRYSLRDLDHGTTRDWSHMILCVMRAAE